MPHITISNLGVGGIIKDRPSHELAPEFWSAGQNVRFQNNKVVKCKGDAEFGYDSWSTIEHPTWLMPYVNSGTIYWLGAGPTSLIRWAGSTLSDVSRGVSTTKVPYNAATSSVWSGCVLGGVPIVNNDSFLDPPQSWDAVNNEFQNLPNWTSGDYAAIIRSYKQYAVALDMTRGTGREPHTVKWSSPALPGTVPGYWDNADTNDSNEQPLSEGGGILIDCLPLGNSNIVYKEEATYTMDLTGGPFVMAFDRVFDQSGLIAPNCVKDFYGKHFVVTNSDIIIHNGQTPESVVEDKYRTWFFNNIEPNTKRKTFVLHNKAMKEMWVCFISNGVAGTFPDKALIWQYDKNTWGIRDLNDEAYITIGLIDRSGTGIYIDDIDSIINNVDTYIDGVLFKQGLYVPVGTPSDTTTDTLVEYDTENTTDLGNMTSYVERTGMTVVGRDHRGNFITDPTSTKFIRRIYPKIEASGSVNIYIGVQEVLNGSVTWDGPHSFNPATDNHIDTRVQGKAWGIKIGSTTDVHWECSGFAVDLEVIGGSVR